MTRTISTANLSPQLQRRVQQELSALIKLSKHDLDARSLESALNNSVKQIIKVNPNFSCLPTISKGNSKRPSYTIRSINLEKHPKQNLKGLFTMINISGEFQLTPKLEEDELTQYIVDLKWQLHFKGTPDICEIDFATVTFNTAGEILNLVSASY